MVDVCRLCVPFAISLSPFAPKIAGRVCAKLDNLEGEAVDFVPTFGEEAVI